MNTETLRDKIAGSFYGLLIGDALGCPVEEYTPQEIHDSFGTITEMEEGKKLWRPRGLHSDDGQQAIMACDSVLASPKYPGKAFAQLIVDMFKAGPKQKFKFGYHRGTGGNFRHTVRSIAEGSGWNEAATLSAGNGAAMRIAPLALFFRDDHDSLCRAVLDLSRVTHSDIRGIAAASAVAYVVASALCSERKAEDFACEDMITFVHGVEELSATALHRRENVHDFSLALIILFPFVRAPRELVLRKIEENANETSLVPGSAASAFALASVVTSLYMFFSSQNFEQALIDTVMLGGDTDTTGAMTGAMCGAHYGLKSIPQRWLNALVAYGSLEDRIDALLVKRTPFTPEISAVELEKDWTETFFY